MKNFAKEEMKREAKGYEKKIKKYTKKVFTKKKVNNIIKKIKNPLITLEFSLIENFTKERVD